MEARRELSIDEVKDLIFKILVDFDKFCKKFNLNYSLAGGTLLGAARHRGFIPWDDDIDIYMPRKDYDFLLRHYNRFGKSKGYKVISCKSRGFYMMIAKIIDTSTLAIEAKRYEKIGVWIDILPVEFVDEISEKEQNTLYSCSEGIYYLGRKDFIATKNALEKIKRIFVRTIKKRRQIKTYNKIIHRHQGNRNICFYSKRRKKVWSILPSDLGFLDSRCTLEFEGKQFRVMKKWEEYLAIYFGPNYMELPPENERISHECALRTIK